MDDLILLEELIQPEDDDGFLFFLASIRILPDNNGEPASVMAENPNFVPDIFSAVSKDGDMPQDYLSEDEIEPPPTYVRMGRKAHKKRRMRFTLKMSKCKKSSKYISIYKSNSTARMRKRSPRLGKYRSYKSKSTSKLHRRRPGRAHQ